MQLSKELSVIHRGSNGERDTFILAVQLSDNSIGKLEMVMKNKEGPFHLAKVLKRKHATTSQLHEHGSKY